MGDLSPHFNRSEFACRCGCGFNTVDHELLSVLEEMRMYYLRPVFINSACRCLEHNREVGSKDTSQHVRARAADVRVEGVEPPQVQSYLQAIYPYVYGIGAYTTFTHIDTRSGGPARW